MSNNQDDDFDYDSVDDSVIEDASITLTGKENMQLICSFITKTLETINKNPLPPQIKQQMYHSILQDMKRSYGLKNMPAQNIFLKEAKWFELETIMS